MLVRARSVFDSFTTSLAQVSKTVVVAAAVACTTTFTFSDAIASPVPAVHIAQHLDPAEEFFESIDREISRSINTFSSTDSSNFDASTLALAARVLSEDRSPPKSMAEWARNLANQK
ncbi:MAG: hypothetical protein ING60_16100 [Rhodocyclaceae bacterium]|nr:hypothetical protein [Rhodocyclaceae bacterium]